MRWMGGRCYLSGNFGANGNSLWLPGLYTKLWPVSTRVGLLLAEKVVCLLSHWSSIDKRRFVLVVIRFVGVAVFVLVNISSEHK